MKLKLFRKGSAVILTVAILFTTVFSMSIFASAATTYSPRLSAPSASNKYYYSNINPFYKYGWGMPNCTAYAFGRAYEILKSEPKLSWNGADQWYGYNKSNGYYKYGSTPKLGAIACWKYDGGGGHVAVVEKIENGKITFSNSAYSGTNFYLSYADVSDSNAGGSSWWNFQGYIYIGDFTTEQTTTTQPETKPVTYKTGIYKTTDYLNMRSGAGTSNSVLCTIPQGKQITVTNVVSDSSYNWGYTSYNGKKGWVAMTYCEFISEIPTTEPTTTVPTTQPTTEPTTVAPSTVVPTTEPVTESATTKPAGLGVGDVNCDGVINVFDATELQKYLSGMFKFTDEKISFCDFNFDGYVTIMDVTAIQMYISQ